MICLMLYKNGEIKYETVDIREETFDSTDEKQDSISRVKWMSVVPT